MDPNALIVTRPPGPSRCLVCGDEIQAGNCVECARCDTRHHRDCFDYSGKCAVYGCASEHFRVIRPPPTGLAARHRGGLARRIEARPRRTVRATGEPIHIEATRPLRTFGLGVIGAGGSLAAALTPACSSSASAGTSSGASVWDLFSGLGTIDAEGFLFLCVLMLVFCSVWAIVRLVVPGLLHLVGYLIHLGDNSYWSVDAAQRRVVLQGRIFGIPFWRWSWSLKGMEEVHLGPAEDGGPSYLTLRFKDSRQLWLADDRCHAQIGYTTHDLERIGRRLAEACDLPFENVARLPRLPAPESE